MSTPAVTVEMDVELSPRVREFLNLQANRIRAFSKETGRQIAMIGEALFESRKQLTGEGNWKSWLRKEFGWSHRHAMDLIYVYQWTSGPEEVKPASPLPIDMSALCLLARPSVPPIAREQAVRMAAQGTAVTKSVAQQVISIHRPVKPVIKAKTRRKTKEEITKEAEAGRIHSNMLRLDSAIIGMRAIERYDPAEIAADLKANSERYTSKEIVEGLPLIIAMLIEIKEELQKLDMLRPAKFGVRKPILLKKVAGGSRQ